jgi:galactokinase/mevalonate kinase-like predicted kinase
MHDPIQYAELVRDIERHDAQVMCGFQDAYMITHGGLRRMDFASKRPDRPGPCGEISSIDAALPFLLITTGVERLSGAVHGPLAERWLKGEKLVVDAMERIAELGRIGALALAHGDWPELAEVMTENHALTASVGGSGEPIDHLIERCVENGAMAAKLAGAGLGGTVIAFVEEPQDLQRRLAEEGYSKFMRPALVRGVRIES